MIFVDVSDELLEMLEPYSEWFFKQDLEPLNELSKNNPKYGDAISYEYACSQEYLDEIVEMDGQHIGYPEVSYSWDLNAGDVPEHFREKQLDLQQELLSFLGARNEAVHVYYPVGGYMGWHNNWNAHGYNILISYTEKGGGFFKYRDPESKEIVHLQDPEGWSCKVGYYGRGREPDKVYYHCAATREPRLTLGYVVPHLDIWRSMIEDISGKSAQNLS